MAKKKRRIIAHHEAGRALAMKRLLLILTMIAAAPAFAGPDDGPPADEGYCIAVAPANCPYNWTYDQGRWLSYGPNEPREDDFGERYSLVTTLRHPWKSVAPIVDPPIFYRRRARAHDHLRAKANP
jgi:hypothetical protein